MHFTGRESYCLYRFHEPIRLYIGDAGKDSLDGICNFAGFGA